MNAQVLMLDAVSRSMIEGGVEQRMLAPLTCAFAPGKLHVVSGPSGAGKTTLLSLLALAVPPSHGLLHWGRVTLSQLNPAAMAAWRRANLGLIFQTSRLVSVMTAQENVCFGGQIRGLDVRGEADRLLDAFGLANKKTPAPRATFRR